MRSFAVVAVLLFIPGASAAFLHRDLDASGDVVSDDGGTRAAAVMPGVDLVALDAQRWEGELLVGARFADEIPQDFDLTITYRIGPEPDMIGIMRFARSDPVGSRPTVLAFFSNRTGAQEQGPVESGAIVGKDAIQFVFPERVLDGLPCFELQSVEVSHLSDEFVFFEDSFTRDATCAPAPVESNVVPTVEAKPNDERAMAVRETPAPVLAVLVGIALAARSHKR